MDSVVIETNRDRMVDETILGELEFYKGKVLLLERDIQSLLDEKEELVMTRDDLTLKNERLNEHLITLMRNLSGQGGNYSDSGSLSYDVDALYLENRYLKEKIKNEEEERHLLVERLTKYKELMDQHQRNEGQRLSPSKKHYATNNTPVDLTNPTTLATLQLPGGRVVNARDVERLINSDSINSMEVSKSNQMYLWSLLVALFEGMQTKNMNLVHARKTNRLLGKRVEELESHLHNYELDGRNSGKGPSLKMSESDRIDSSSARSTPSTISVSRHNDPLDGTDGNLSSATAKETSEDENDELSSTAISTPSTTRHSMSIERQLKALQNEVLADQVPSPTKLDYASLHLNHRSGTSHRYRDFDSRKPSPATSLFH
ncbi:hypothetical protein RDWZM_005534 [Blomia tropicalis]|uniref:Uncharacterized protein n=1 Tax=Blomia tropicalis TaxID=40697 RepID=A0A9Q0M8M1_BLOTA|nr:hypothetical protein RDWZM_005534 [Blomia tropicalis]